MTGMPQIAALSQLVKEAPAVGAMMDDGPVMLTAKSQRFGVLVGIDQWNQMIVELEKHRMFAESRRIAARNDANDSWIDGDEMDRRMIERGVVTAEELAAQES